MIGLGTGLKRKFFNGAAGGFVGVLDAYSSELAGAWSVCFKLLTNYNGPLARIRRASDNTELDISADSNGFIDQAAIQVFAGASNWFLRTVYNQSGASGRDIGMSSASAQPRGAIGADGLVYVFAPNSGFSSTGMTSALLSIPATETTHWSVGASAAFNFDMMTIRFSSGTERRMSNYSNAIIGQLSTAGTTPQISTNTGRYSATFQIKSSGSRVCNGIIAGTGTKSADSVTINYMMIGQGGGGNFWSQNSSWLAAAVWTKDLGDSNADAIHTAAKPLFNTQ